MMQSNKKIIFILTFTICSALLDSVFSENHFNTLLEPSGRVSFAPNIFGQNNYSDLNPGYRTDLFIYMDIFKYNDWIFSFYTGNTTLISRDSNSLFTLDRIRYTLSPVLRRPFRRWIVTGMLFHECIHTISRPEIQGAIYWNTIRLGAGTKAAYHFYLVDKYITRDVTLRNSFDVRLDVDFYLRSRSSKYIEQNHNYQFGTSSLIRYHFDIAGSQFFTDCIHQFWLDDQREWMHKLAFSLHLVLLGRKKLSTIYVQYTILDDNPHDNEDSLTAIGFRMIF